MPDETDTLSTSQSSSQNFSAEKIAETFSQSETSSQTMLQALSSILSNSVTSIQTMLQEFPESISNSQQSDLTMFTGREEIPVIRTNINGVAPLTQIQSNSENNHYFKNDDPLVFLEVISESPTVQSITIETSYIQDELDLEERVVSIPAGATKYVGMFPFYVYNQGLIYVYVNPSNNSLKFRAFKVM